MGAVTAVGVLHTMVPDHWAPITLIARQRGWSKMETARAALGAGTGRVLSTLFLGLIVWVAGVAVATKFGRWIEIIARVALIAFGLWIAVSGWREMTSEQNHEHAHAHGHDHHHHENAKGNGRPSCWSWDRLRWLKAYRRSLLRAIMAWVIAVMSVVFAVSTIATYMALCVASVAGLERVKLGAIEQYGEVLSGAFIALVGVLFWIWPVL